MDAEITEMVSLLNQHRSFLQEALEHANAIGGSVGRVNLFLSGARAASKALSDVGRRAKALDRSIKNDILEAMLTGLIRDTVDARDTLKHVLEQHRATEKSMKAIASAVTRTAKAYNKANKVARQLVENEKTVTFLIGHRLDPAIVGEDTKEVQLWSDRGSFAAYCDQVNRTKDGVKRVKMCADALSGYAEARKSYESKARKMRERLAMTKGCAGNEDANAESLLKTFRVTLEEDFPKRLNKMCEMFYEARQMVIVRLVGESERALEAVGYGLGREIKRHPGWGKAESVAEREAAIVERWDREKTA